MNETEQLTGIKPQDRQSARQAIGVLRRRGVNAATEVGAQPPLPRRDEVDALLEQQE